MSVRVLITGAQGFIGRYLAADWLAADDTASVLGVGRSERQDAHFTHAIHWADQRLQAPLPADLARALRSERYAYRALDLADTARLTDLVAEFRPSIIVHLAASLRDDPPARLVATNIGTVVSVLEAVAAARAAPRILFGSSGSVYGPVPEHRLPIREDTPCAPTDPYAATKRAAEELGAILAERCLVPAIWARIFNPVGPGQDERHLCGWLGRQIAAIAGHAMPPVVTVGPLHTTRDYIDVRDTASALRRIAIRGEPGCAYNVAAGEETRGQEILDTMLELTGLAGRIELKRRPARPVDVNRAYADVERLAGLGHEARFDLNRSLADVLSYYRACGAAVARRASTAGTNGRI